MQIYPFRGIVYNKQKVRNLSKVFCPPYDVISPAKQDEYYKSSPYNIIRVILNKPQALDDDKNNPYTRAAGFFNKWLEEGILIDDQEPCIYIYGQKFKYKAKTHNPLGFIAIAKIGDSSDDLALPHEKTFAAPRQDRERLMYAVNANLSCIYTVFQDEDSGVNSFIKDIARTATNFIDVEIDGVRHRVSRVCKKDTFAKLQDLMKDKKVFIADGHHRYEAAVNLRNKMQREDQRYAKQKGYNFVMMYFASLQDEGITILSTHRLIRHLGGRRLAEFLDEAKRYFAVLDADREAKMFEMMESEPEGAHIFGCYCKGKFIVLKLKDDKRMLDEYLCRDFSPDYKKLDVVILHSLILEKILGLDKTENEKAIFYTRESDVAIRLVDEGKYEAAFFLNPTRVSQVRDISLTFDRMPHKSTYFYPKLLSGVVMRRLGGLEVIGA